MFVRTKTSTFTFFSVNKYFPDTRVSSVLVKKISVSFPKTYFCPHKTYPFFDYINHVNFSSPDANLFFYFVKYFGTNMIEGEFRMSGNECSSLVLSIKIPQKLSLIKIPMTDGD